jgi:hypothetical protein
VVPKEARSRGRNHAQQARVKASSSEQKKKEPEAAIGGKPCLRLIVKTDVAGSEEAICQALAAFPQGKVTLHILRSDVGDINNSDIELAEASNGLDGVFFVGRLRFTSYFFQLLLCASTSGPKWPTTPKMLECPCGPTGLRFLFFEP